MRNPHSIACEVWSLRFQDKLYNSDSLLFVLIFFVILLLIIHFYMYETRSWHTYSYAFGFVLKIGCDTSGHGVCCKAAESGELGSYVPAEGGT